MKFRQNLIDIRSRHLNGDTWPTQLVEPDVSQNCEQPAFDVAFLSQPPDGGDSTNIGFLYKILSINTIARKRQSVAVQSIDMLAQHIGFGCRSIRSEEHSKRLSIMATSSHMS